MRKERTRDDLRLTEAVNRIFRLVRKGCEPDPRQNFWDLKLTKHERNIAIEFQAKGFSLYRHGWPDFIAVKDGRVFAVEVKQLGERLRPEQSLMHNILGNIGIPVHVIESTDAASDLAGTTSSVAPSPIAHAGRKRSSPEPPPTDVASSRRDS